MQRTSKNDRNTIIIFFPFELKNIRQSYLYGDFDIFSESVRIFFSTKISHTHESDVSEYLFGNSTLDPVIEKNNFVKNWIYLEVNQGVLSLKELKVEGEHKDISEYYILWINYNFSVFSKCEIFSSDLLCTYNKSYFKYLKDKINEKTNAESNEHHQEGHIRHIFLNFLSFLNLVIFNLAQCSLKLLPVTKYFSIALHMNNYLNGFLWAVKSAKEKKKLDIKVMNFLLSILMDMVLGILFLRWLNSKISLDASANLFLLTAESVVNSIKNLINWLRGDPAGLKLNWAFNKILATFYSYHIDIWWTFLVFLKPAVKIIFQVFLKLGLLGITFQASITADLLALVSFHVYCIHAYAAKLFNIQISSLVSLWRLFLGRKKNPLREKVDSCRYSPEQLFIGTLAFTILLFLLPTTLLYYVVFTSIKLLILIMGGILKVIQYFNQTLPVYTTILWIMRSPKISAGIEIEPCKDFATSDLILLKLKPVLHNWWETVVIFIPECVERPIEFNLRNFLNIALSYKLIYPLLNSVRW